MRALAYARQSITDDDETLSLDSQVSAVTAFALERGWTVVGEVRDANQKGYDDERPGLVELRERARVREYDVLVVWSLDRLARSVKLTENLVDELRGQGVQIVSLKETWADKPMMRQILAAVAEEQTRVIAGHVRRALQERAKRGLHHGRVPYGYGRDAATQVLVPSEHEAQVVREVFARYVGGETFTAIARWLDEAGIPTSTAGRRWRPTTVRVMIANPVYTGAVVFGEQVTPDCHAAIIAPAMWDQAQARRASYSWSRKKPVGSYLEGSLFHGCGAPMYVRSVSGKMAAPAVICGRRYQYRSGEESGCLVSPANAPLAYVEAQAWKLIVRGLGRLRVVDDVLRDLRRQEREGAPARVSEREQLAREQVKLQARRERVRELYADGVEDRAWYDREAAKVKQRLAEIERALVLLPAPVDEQTVRDRDADLRMIAAQVEQVRDQRGRSAILRRLGTVVVDAGPRGRPVVRIAWHAHVRDHVERGRRA